MDRNIHKKITEEDKFARKWYCRHTRLAILRSQKKQQSKQFRKYLKLENSKELEEWRKNAK